MSRPGSSGRSSTFHAGGHLGARGGVGHRPAAGQKVAAPHRLPARRAHRRAAGPSRAGRRSRSASRSAAEYAPGEVASRSPTRIDRARRRSSPSSASSAAASPPGAVAIERAAHLRPARGWRTARSTVTSRPRLRTALRSRRKTIGDSSSGSKPDQQHGGRGLEVGVGDRHRPARDGGGEEVRLLVGVRAAAEVDVVGAQHDPGELGVGVGVLERRPGRRPARRRGRPPRSARGRRPRRPPTTTPGAGCRRRRAPAGWRSGRPAWRR